MQLAVCTSPKCPTGCALSVAGLKACPPVSTGTSIPLYQDVTTFTPELSPDFGRGTFPAYMLDTGIVAASLDGSGVPLYARHNGYTRTTSGAHLGVSCLSPAFGLCCAEVLPA